MRHPDFSVKAFSDSPIRLFFRIVTLTHQASFRSFIWNWKWRGGKNIKCTNGNSLFDFVTYITCPLIFSYKGSVTLKNEVNREFEFLTWLGSASTLLNNRWWHPILIVRDKKYRRVIFYHLDRTSERLLVWCWEEKKVVSYRWFTLFLLWDMFISDVSLMRHSKLRTNYHIHLNKSFHRLSASAPSRHDTTSSYCVYLFKRGISKRAICSTPVRHRRVVFRIVNSVSVWCRESYNPTDVFNQCSVRYVDCSFIHPPADDSRPIGSVH